MKCKQVDRFPLFQGNPMNEQKASCWWLLTAARRRILCPWEGEQSQGGSPRSQLWSGKYQYEAVFRFQLPYATIPAAAMTMTTVHSSECWWHDCTLNIFCVFKWFDDMIDDRCHVAEGVTSVMQWDQSHDLERAEAWTETHHEAWGQKLRRPGWEPCRWHHSVMMLYITLNLLSGCGVL